MSRTHLPAGHEATALLRLASGSEQFVLPYVQATFAGQQAGQATSGLGGSAGHGGLGGALAPTRQAPRVHRARLVPQRPKSHVVPSGSRQTAPFAGAASGHSSVDTEPPSSPPSEPDGAVSKSVAHAAASAVSAEPSTSAAAIRGSGPRRRLRRVAATWAE
jgi:hypothetical protein